MLIWYFDFTIFTLVNVSHTCLQFYIYIFNFTVTRLSWHVLYYLISKNLYSLQNAQPFIYQLICMQLCKCINCFSKAHNKQLNQYCLNFTIFFYQKKSFKKMVWVRVGSQVNLFLLWVKKIEFRSGIFRVGSENSDPFYHV